MKSTLTTYSMYDLSNPHFSNTEILTSKNKIIRGQFVQFRVLKGNVEYLYPAEKYCFLPSEKSKLFWDDFNSTKGEFSEFPDYIMELGLNDIAKISIVPNMFA